MHRLPSRLRRLDDALAALPVDEPMLLTELDGFLTGVVLSPVPVPDAEWLPHVWAGAPAAAPFEDPIDARWFADAVTARRDEIARDLANRRPRPIYDVDERDGALLWEFWIDGFAQAMALRAEAWRERDAADPDGAATLALLVAVAHDDSDLDSVAINAVSHEAPQAIADLLLRLHDTRPHVAAIPAARGRIGRNDPCPCGSGRKSKRCCAEAA